MYFIKICNLVNYSLNGPFTERQTKTEVGSRMLLTTDVGHCCAAMRKEWAKKNSHFIALIATDILSRACYQSGWLLVHLCIMGGRLWSYLWEIQIRALFYCDLWCNKSFIAMGKHPFLLPCTGSYHQEREWKQQAGTRWKGLTVFSCRFERSLWVSGSEGVPDEASSSP